MLQPAQRGSGLLQTVGADAEEREVTMRSFLFVPGDSERKLVKGAASGSDALVLDLEDAVPGDRIETARGMVREYLRSNRDRSRTQLWVRINPLTTEKA